MERLRPVAKYHVVDTREAIVGGLSASFGLPQPPWRLEIAQ
jgi:hypothetical protein